MIDDEWAVRKQRLSLVPDGVMAFGEGLKTLAAVSVPDTAVASSKVRPFDQTYATGHLHETIQGAGDYEPCISVEMHRSDIVEVGMYGFNTFT